MLRYSNKRFFGLSKWLAQAILSGRHRPQCLGSKIKKVRHVVTIQYSAHVVLIYLRTKMFVHLWNAFIHQKYHEPLLTIKTSVMKTESLVHIVECVTCSELWMRVDLQSSVQLSALWGKSFQRCYHWADILRPSSLTLHKLTSLHSWQSTCLSHRIWCTLY